MSGLSDIARNDLAAARAYYEGKGARLTQGEYIILWRLQDDPEAFEEMASAWRVAKRARNATEVAEAEQRRALAAYERARGRS